MKKAILSFILMFTATFLMAQKTPDLTGVYSTKNGDTHVIWMFIDGYSSQTIYQRNACISTFGGPYTYQDGKLHRQIDDNEADVGRVGGTKSGALSVDVDGLREESGRTWIKNAGRPQDLDGLWRTHGRN